MRALLIAFGIVFDIACSAKVAYLSMCVCAANDMMIFPDPFVSMHLNNKWDHFVVRTDLQFSSANAKNCETNLRYLNFNNITITATPERRARV